jgi:hypothetical protein
MWMLGETPFASPSAAGLEVSAAGDTRAVDVLVGGIAGRRVLGVAPLGSLSAAGLHVPERAEQPLDGG